MCYMLQAVSGIRHDFLLYCNFTLTFGLEKLFSNAHSRDKYL